MGVGRAQDVSIGCIRHMDIVDELAAAREEAQVLGPQHWLSNCAARILLWVNPVHTLAAAPEAWLQDLEPAVRAPVATNSGDRPPRESF